MKISWKRVFAVGGFLAGLCGVLGLLIAGGDLLTKDTIAKNKIEKESKGLRKIFGEEATYGEAVAVTDETRPTLQKYWTVQLGGTELGRVYSASGKNAYGDVSLLIGIYADYSLGTIYVLENTESYGTTLQENYLDVYDASDNKEEAVEQVSCGATYGAKLCREMILASKSHYEGGAE